MSKFIFGFLLLSPLLAQTNPCSTATGVNSEALKWLGNTGVYLNNELQFPNVTTCNGIFQANGTCCDVDSTVAKINTIHSKMVTKWSAYVDRLVRVRALIPSLTKLAPLLTVTLMNSKIAQLNSVGASIRLNDILPAVPRDDASISSVVDVINNFENYISNFKQYGQTCFETLRNARANLFCAMCSANAADYASPQSEFSFRYRISNDSCTKIANDCFPAYKFTFLMTSAMQTLLVFKARLTGPRIRPLFRSEAALSSDAIASLYDVFNNCSFDINAVAMACGDNTNINMYRARLCTMGFLGNKHNGFIEGDSSIASDMDGMDVDNLINTEAVQNKRRLQQTFEPALGVFVSTIGITFDDIHSTSTELLPAATIDTSTAGDSATSSAWITGVVGGCLALAIPLFLN